jgi:hypothetical protein
MKSIVLAVGLALGLAGASANAQISIGIGLPSVQIGINVPQFPQLVVVPGYPVYYAPSVDGNLFFYDGLYWSLNGDSWYSSSWYNGPWNFVEPEAVPMYLWRVPVRYYRRPPPYFRGWGRDEPPRWGEHWGRDWEERHRGWDHWDRREAPPPAPLPDYQRGYRGERYPQGEQQQAMHQQNYHYEHQDPVVRERMYGPQGRGPEQHEDRGHGHDHERDHERDR